MGTGIEFKPKVLGFLCNWCCYGGADLAGVSRLQYPPYIRVVRLMCSGRVEPAFILKAFSEGTDGVFIGGCHFNDCHYITHGNYHAIGMVLTFRKIMEEMGLNPARLRIEWVSAGEGIRFAQVMNDFALSLKEYGPLGSGEGIGNEQLNLNLKAVARLLPYIKLVLSERLSMRFETTEDYMAYYEGEEFAGLFRELIADKLAIHRIILILQEKPFLSGEELCQALNISPSQLSRHLQYGAAHGLVSYAGDGKNLTLINQQEASIRVKV